HGEKYSLLLVLIKTNILDCQCLMANFYWFLLVLCWCFCAESIGASGRLGDAGADVGSRYGLAGRVRPFWHTVYGGSLCRDSVRHT
ncbi:hypothetical protein WDZ92_49640, partial [Nostoc sp. NIES-2111]